jgi:hypothetical protein
MPGFDGIEVGSEVRVFMGAGWQRGVVTGCHADSISVKLQLRLVRVFDIRNVKANVRSTGRN